MKDSNVKTTFASVLRAAGVRRTTAKDEETEVTGTATPEILHGALRDVFGPTSTLMASPQTPGVPSPEVAESIDIELKPIALAAITHGWWDTPPTLSQSDGEAGQLFSFETKPWRVEQGSDALPAAAEVRYAGPDLAALLTAAASGTGRTGGAALTDTVEEESVMTGASMSLDVGVQQLVQAMAGFAPQAAGAVLTVSSPLQDALGTVVANPLA